MAVGFSYDTTMVIVLALNYFVSRNKALLNVSKFLKKNDSVVVCKRVADGSFKVHTYYTPPLGRSISYVNVSDPSVGLSQMSADVSGTAFSCAFRRVKRIASLSDKFFDLNNPFFIIMAHGSLDSSGDLA